MIPDRSMEPSLSADFATRVLSQVDIARARRRWARRIFAGTGGAALAALGMVFWTGVSSTPPERAGRQPPLYVAMSAAAGSKQDDAENALTYLFPDAEPVARFASRYSDAGPDADLLADQDSESQ